MTRDILHEAFGAMRHDLRKTLLTMLGMAWGIATVVLLLAYGAGFGRAIEVIFANWGTRIIGVFPGRTSQQAAALEQGLENERRITAQQRDFVSMTSHEFRTPLTVVDAHAQRLIKMSGKLSPGDMAGASFTISSLGGIGGTAFTPIVNAPEVAILGVVRSKMAPVWDGQDFKPKLMLPVCVSYDHRVIDGAAAARVNAYLGSILGDFRRVIL